MDMPPLSDWSAAAIVGGPLTENPPIVDQCRSRRRSWRTTTLTKGEVNRLIAMWREADRDAGNDPSPRIELRPLATPLAKIPHHSAMHTDHAVRSTPGLIRAR